MIPGTCWLVSLSPSSTWSYSFPSYNFYLLVSSSLPFPFLNIYTRVLTGFFSHMFLDKRPSYCVLRSCIQTEKVPSPSKLYHEISICLYIGLFLPLTIDFVFTHRFADNEYYDGEQDIDKDDSPLDVQRGVESSV